MKYIISLILVSVGYTVLYAQQQTQSEWQQHVSYSIDAKLNDEDHTLQSHISMVYTNESPSELREIYMHLWPNAYSSNTTAFARQELGNKSLDFHYSEASERGSITGLAFKVDGELVEWEEYNKHPDIAVIKLNKPLASGASIVIETPFTVKVPEVFSRLGHSGQNYYITQWYPKPAVYDVNGWNPMPYLNQGEFYSEFGDFEVCLTVPSNYVVCATGVLQDSSEYAFWEDRADYPLKLPEDSVPATSETWKTITFRAEQVHDFAWFASKSFNLLQSQVEIEGRKIDLRVFDQDPRTKHLEAIEKAIVYYSENVGAYPYPHATVVNGDLRAGGGMEYPMITICNGLNEEVIVHEVGHNWFYGILGNNERAYPWMDESINSFYENSAVSSARGHAMGNVMSMLVSQNILTSNHQAVGLSSEEYTKINYGVSVYTEGARAFVFLEAYLGKDEFKKAMKEYYETWKFRHPLPGDMRASFEATTGKDLGWFFNDLLMTNRGIDYKIARSRDRIELSNVGEVTAPIPVEFTYMGETTTKWYMVPAGKSIFITSPYGKQDQAIVDPDQISFDYNPSNDALNNEFRLKPAGGFRGKGFKTLYASPSLQWNMYDKWMLGFNLHNMGMPFPATTFNIRPVYSFNTEQVNGLFKLMHMVPLEGPSEHLTFSLVGQKYSWSLNGFQEYNYFKVQPKVTYDLPKTSLRSPISQSIDVVYDYIGFTPNFDLESERAKSRNGKYRSLAPWQFVNVNYNYDNKRALNPYGIHMGVEYGVITDRYHLVDSSGIDSLNFPLLESIDETNDFFRISASFNLKLDIGLKKKPLEIRMFASYFLKSPSNGYFSHNIGWTGLQSFRDDYRMEELTMHRNAREGMFRNQITDQGSQSRFVGVVASSDKLIANAIITAPLPGKLPIKPYIELLTYTDIDKAQWNVSGSSLIYNVGLELRIIPGYFSVYFNVAQSSDVTDRQVSTIGFDPNAESIKFMERVTFNLNLSKLMNLKMDDLNIF